jgi:hypothetical protein
MNTPTTYAGVRWLVPRMTPPGELTRANSVVALSDQMPLLVGTALVGPSFALFGAAGSVAVAAAMLVGAFVLALRLPRVHPERDPAIAHPSAPNGAGRWPARVVALIALSTVYYLVYGPFETASPAFIRDELDGGGSMHHDRGHRPAALGRSISARRRVRAATQPAGHRHAVGRGRRSAGARPPQPRPGPVAERSWLRSGRRPGADRP